MKSSSTSPQRQAKQDTSVASPPTIAPQRAVQDYLNALLQDATTLALAEEVQTVETAAPVVEPPVLEKVEAIEVEVPASIADVELEESTAAAQSWVDGRPPWAQQRFECLLFKVAGLTLAVPLVELGGVLVVEDELKPLFGQPDWFLGLLRSKTEGTVKAIDTARWVMPEKYPEDLRESFKYVILMQGSEWGMACHAVEDAITLEPDQVRWRSDRGRRPWLAGTVIDHMCAIMDVSALLALIEQSQAENAKRNKVNR
ncbi:MAG: chemotaxis protein CheW [Halopseudomonas sp.]